MARYKPYSYDQTKLIPISYDRQILPGTFERTLSEVIDTLDMSVFNGRYHNDETGAPAYDPKILLKVVLYAYSHGIIGSRRIGALCADNVIFMALSADSRPHFTTIADFISTLQEEIVTIFRHVVMISMQMDLIDASMFAIDGCKLPSNASKEWSGTKEELRKKKEKLEQALRHMIRSHVKQDESDKESDGSEERFKERLCRARAKIEKLDKWLESSDDKVSGRGYVRQSNVTDNESAKMKTSHGVVQGYNGIAVVDSKHQVIVSAEAHGEGQDHQLLKPALEAAKQTLKATGFDGAKLEGTVVAADTGFHASENLEYLEREGIDGYVPDSNFRKRDPRFATAGKYKDTNEKEQWGKAHFDHADFTYAKKDDCYVCPAGKRLEYATSDLTTNGLTYYKYVAKQRHCGGCGFRSHCITKDTHKVRAIFRRSDGGENVCSRMREKIDTQRGREMYSKRMAIVEPVFGNMRHAKRLDRFTLRTRKKVNVQWLFYCMVHNIEKICNFGSAPFACACA